MVFIFYFCSEFYDEIADQKDKLQGEILKKIKKIPVPNFVMMFSAIVMFIEVTYF